MQMPIASDRLLAFVTVAREKGFSRAAKVLGKTQSAVSQAVLHLEEELGQRLFVRDGRATRPTQAGLALLEDAERILADMARARERLAALGAADTGRLDIGTSDTLACHVLPPVLAAFRERHPGIELRLDNRPSPATALLVSELGVDVGVVALPLPDGLESRGRPIEERLRVEPLARYSESVILPPGHELSRKQKVHVRDLEGVPLLLLDRTTGSRRFLDLAFERASVRPRVTMEMSSVEVLKKLVTLGFGVSVVPTVAVDREVSDGSLVARPLSPVDRARRIALLTPRVSRPARAAEAFAEILRSVLSERPMGP
ncbi:MAG TPA: LysR family transcriptional regulator [Polyangiaceae bacterium]|nr:LysR family transcriptional regulator [Polyangiaceae bacterium]